MLRLIAAGLGGVLLLAVLFTGIRPAEAANAADSATIEEIMKALYGKPNFIHKTLGKALNESSVNWDEASKLSKDYAKYAAALPGNQAPKGDKASWAKLTKQTATDAQALDTAVGGKNKEAALAAWGKLNKSCMACHDEHRE